MPKRFAPVEHAIEKGLSTTSPSAGASLVSDWAKELEGLQAPGAKALHGELVQLEKELKKDEPDSKAITKLLQKIGPETVKLADKCEDAKLGEKVRSLGEALSHAGG